MLCAANPDDRKVDVARIARRVGMLVIIRYFRAPSSTTLFGSKSTSFRGTLFLETVVLVVGELSYHAARITNR